MKTNLGVLFLAILLIVAVIIIVQKPFSIKEESQLGIIKPEIGEVNVGLNVGNKAPNFALEDVSGDVAKLSDFKGKILFVNFWASWCPFCVDEMPDIQNAAKKFNNVQVLFINRGEKPETGSVYLKNRLPVKIDYPILWDPDEKVSKTYILYGMPVSYILDENGVIKFRKFGSMTFEEIQMRLSEVVG